MRKLSYLILFLMIPCLGISQYFNNDSLLNILESQTDPEEKAETYFSLGESYFLYNNDTALYYFNFSYELAQKTDNLHLISKVTAKISLCYQYTDPEKFAEYAILSVEAAEKSEDSYLICYARTLLGNVYRFNGEYDKAMKEYKYSENVAKVAGDTLQWSRTLNNIGIIHMIQAEYDVGIEYWQRSLDLKLIIGEESAAASTMSNIALYYKDIGRYYEAKEYLDKSLAINMREKDYESVAFNYTVIGDMHWRMDKPAEAEKAYKLSIAYSDSINTYYDKKEAFIGLSRVLDSLGRHKEALEYQRLYSELMEKLYNENRERITMEMTTQFETEKKEKENELLKSENDAKDAKIALEEANNRYLWIGLGLAFVIMVLIVFVLVRVRQAKVEIEEQKHIVEEKNREITDSISYAKRLQDAILPESTEIDATFKENFVFYLPKDIVAGDFYWMEKVDDCVMLAVADCTGHGVPGAMVSVVCHNALNRAVREFALRDPGKILDKVTDLVIETFERRTEEVKDGMDISLCIYDFNNSQVRFAGANNGLYHITNGELNEIRPNKQPVGKHTERTPFDTQLVNFNKGDVFYQFTDGYADQFGGEKGKKMKYKPFKNILISNHKRSMKAQLVALTIHFEKWKGDLEQIDDVCIVGVKV